MIRYFDRREKEGKEVLILPSLGCAYAQCAFCDYYKDKVENIDTMQLAWANELNKLRGGSQVDIYMSGSIVEVPFSILAWTVAVLRFKDVKKVLFEQRWEYRDLNASLRDFLDPIPIEIWVGIESWDAYVRESILGKGISGVRIKEVEDFFDGAFFLVGFPGQTKTSIIKTVNLNHISKINAKYNIYTEVRGIKPDKELIGWFRLQYEELLEGQINWLGVNEYETENSFSSTA